MATFLAFFEKKRLHTVAQIEFFNETSQVTDRNFEKWCWISFIRQEYNLKIDIFKCGCFELTQKKI